MHLLVICRLLIWLCGRLVHLLLWFHAGLHLRRGAGTEREQAHVVSLAEGVCATERKPATAAASVHRFGRLEDDDRTAH